MNDEFKKRLKDKIELAKSLSAGEEYEREVFTAILITEMLKDSTQTASLDIAKPMAHKKISVKEFLIEKKPSDDVQRTAALGYYLEKFDGITPFSSKDITDCFINAREKVPDNVSDKVYLCTKKGWMMEVGADKEKKVKLYQMTSKGERAVENSFKPDKPEA